MQVVLSGVDGAPAVRWFVHDVFVIHADADLPFIQGYLLPERDCPPNDRGRAWTDH